MIIAKAESFIWKTLLILIFLRPFLNEYAFPLLGFWYISSLILLSGIYLFFSRRIALFSSPFNLTVSLFLIVMLISLALLGFTKRGLFGLFFFMPNFLIFYITSRIKYEYQEQLLTTIFLAAIIVSIYGIYEYFIGFKQVLEYIRQTGGNTYLESLLVRERTFSTFLSPNRFASYIAMMLFLGIGFFISVPRNKKITYWLYAAIMAAALLLTKSLGGILVFILTLLFFTACLLYKSKPDKLIFKKSSLNLAYIALIFIPASLLAVWQRLPSFINANNPDNSIIQRFYYWQTSLSMAKDHLLTGVGWGNFELFYGFYKPALANMTRYAHNVFLQIMAELGLLGLLSFSLVTFLFLKTALRVIKTGNKENLLKISLFCGGCAFLIHNLIDISFYSGQVCLFWWIILGLFAQPLKDA